MSKGTNLVKLNHLYEVSGGTLKILAIQSALKVLIEWQDEFRHQQFVRAGDIKTGRVRNPFKKTIMSLGWVGVGEYSTKSHPREYNYWRAMIYRCHSITKTRNSQAYINVEIHEPWYCFQNFAEWCNSRADFKNDDWELDKDILIKVSKIYSPTTCCFVPKQVNLLFMRDINRRGEYPVGVCKNKKWFASSCAGRYLGIFSTAEEAFMAYKVEKERMIREVADVYKEQLSSDTYIAMMNYCVEVSD